MGSRRLSVTVFVICTSCLCLCSVLTYLLHPLPHFLSFPNFFLGACCWCCMSNSSPWDWEQNLQNVLPAACNFISTRYAQILFLERCSFWTAVTCRGILCGVQLQLDYKYKHWPFTCCYYQNLMLTTLESCCCCAYKVKILYHIWYYSCNSHIGWSCWCNLLYEIWGSLTGVTEDSFLLGCDAVSLGVGSLIVPSPSGSTNPVYNITSKNNWISGLLC